MLGRSSAAENCRTVDLSLVRDTNGGGMRLAGVGNSHADAGRERSDSAAVDLG
jgi:hypothetical protein